MTRVSVDEAELRLAELAEKDETVVLTRDSLPVVDIVPHRRRGGLNLAAGDAHLRMLGVTNPFRRVDDDFDDPLPEDVLLRPLP